jgi:hypothetical protein
MGCRASLDAPRPCTRSIRFIHDNAFFVMNKMIILTACHLTFGVAMFIPVLFVFRPSSRQKPCCLLCLGLGSQVHKLLGDGAFLGSGPHNK